MSVSTYRMGLILVAVFLVVLIFQKYSLRCDNLDDNKSIKTTNDYFYNKDTGVPNQPLEMNIQTKRSRYNATKLKAFFKENRKSALSVQQFDPEKYVPNKSTEYDYKAEVNNLLKQKVTENDIRLIEIIRNYFIEQPSTEPYNIENPDQLEFSAGQTPLVDSRLNYIEGGFYVECGALNGETSSTSFFFERVRKWNGLLIEADPSNYALLKSKHRKAFSVNACLSTTPNPSKVTFNKAFQRGRVMEDNEAKQWIKGQGLRPDTVEIECFPFYSFMLALNRTTVDFFSLDVEGDEIKILKTIPFDKINIKMLTVEYLHTPGGEKSLQTFMEKKGYEVVANIRKGYAVGDLIFIKKSLQ